jgi:peptidylprolyl isomerase
MPVRPRSRPAPARASLAAVALALTLPATPAAGQDAPGTPADVLAAAPESAWRDLAPENTLYMELEGGRRVIIELAPRFAPRHVENIRAMVRAGLFDGGEVVRSQDNYVAQWSIRSLDRGDVPEGVSMALEAEFAVPAAGMRFTPLPDGDVYAPQVGFVDGFPTAMNANRSEAWMAHCYGTVGVARGEDPNSGSGAALYAVNGHSPRHLDRNLSMPGRVVAGMEHLSSLPRGEGNLGFYDAPGAATSIVRVRVGSEVPVAERTTLRIMRTDSPSFRDWIRVRRSRQGGFWYESTDRIEICNVSVPTRGGEAG